MKRTLPERGIQVVLTACLLRERERGFETWTRYLQCLCGAHIYNKLINTHSSLHQFLNKNDILYKLKKLEIIF